MTVKVEVCVEDVAGAVTADIAGAHRVELCNALYLGGITPSIGTFIAALDGVHHVGIHSLIRPRGGDFVFSAAEVTTMVADIAVMRQLGRNAGTEVGFVIGALTSDGEIDHEVCAELISAADGAPVSFHRAFDITSDVNCSLDTLIELGISRVLTSGGAERATAGMATLAELVARGDGRIDIMAGGGVRLNNVAEIVAETAVRDVHFRAPQAIANATGARTIRMTLGPTGKQDTRDITSRALIDDMMALMSSL